MPTINDLRQQAATIKNATQVGENTANRVGTTFETIADLLESMGGVANLSTIDIGSIDTLNTTGDMLVGTPNIYTLTMTRGSNTFKVGTLFQFANNGRYDVAQVIVSQFIVDADGRIDTTSADQEVHIFYRLCKTMNGGSLPTPIGTWTTWTELGGSGGSGVTIDQYPTQNSGNAVSSGGVFERLQDVAPKVDISAIDDIDEYSDMLAGVSPFYVVTKTLSGNVFRIGTLMEFANQGRYILYQILATDYVLNDDGTLDTTLSENGGLKLIWRMKQFSGNPPAGVTIGVWSAWSYLSGGGGGEVDAYTKSETDALLAGKQNTISDLSTIRSGASAGATAVQPAAMNAALNAKQDTINDLATIRSNAAAGATAYQKPSTGIPKTDLAPAVQTSLGKADTALQTHQSLANYYTKSQVDNLIVPQGVDAVPVTSLPATGSANTLYFLQGTNSFTINAWNGSAWGILATISGTYDAGFALN